MANKMQSLIRLQCLLALSCAALLVVGTSHAEECAPLSAEVRARVARYAAEHYELAPDVRVEGGETVSNACFQGVTLEAVAPRRNIELCPSPGRGFLTESLLHTSVDPVIERQRAASVA